MDSDASTLSLPPLPAQKLVKTRKITACDPCRLSKQRCDRAKPCSTCVKKKAPQDCVWKDSEVRRAAVLAKDKDQSENDDLRNEVDRLQKLVNVLVDARLQPSTSLQPQVAPPVYSPASPQVVPTVPLVPKLTEQNAVDDDLAERLFNLSISSFATAPTSLEMCTEHVLSIDDVQRLLENFPPNPTHKPATSFPFLRRASPSLGEVMACLPALHESVLSETYYWSCTSWFFHPLPEYVYRRHKESVYAAYSSNEVADPVSLSIVLAVLGIGANCRFTYTRTGGSKAELLTARSLIEMSAAALAHSTFLEEPTLDAIRALSLLAIFQLSIGPGDEGSLGIALTGFAVQASLQMKLHRDPSQLYPVCSFRDAEERRSVIHHVYLLDGIASASYSRGYILLHARDITAAFPLDLHDGELEIVDCASRRPPEETVMTSLIERFKVSRYSEQVTEELLGSGSPTYEPVLELDRQLDELCSGIHPLYQWEHLSSLELNNAANELRAWRISIVWIALWREKLRLHRPFLRRAYSDPTFAYSRRACIHASRGLLAIHACPANSIPAAGFTHKAVLACIILGLEIIIDKDGPETAEYRDLIAEAVERLDKFTQISIIARRGVKIIRFLLDKAKDDPSPPPKKRSKSLSSLESDIATPPHVEHQQKSSKSSLELGSPSLTEPIEASELLAELGLAFPNPPSSHSFSSSASPNLFSASSSSLLEPESDLFPPRSTTLIDEQWPCCLPGFEPLIEPAEESPLPPNAAEPLLDSIDPSLLCSPVVNRAKAKEKRDCRVEPETN